MITLVALLVLAISSPIETEQTLFIDHEHAGYRHLPELTYDPVFVRVSIRNESDQPLILPQAIFSAVDYRIQRDSLTYTYPRQQTVSDKPAEGLRKIQPGQKLPIDYRILSIPPVEQIDHSFWDITGVTIHSRVKEIPRQYFPMLGVNSNNSASSAQNKSRSSEEDKFLEDIFREAKERSLVTITKDGESSSASPELVPANEISLAAFGIEIHHLDLRDRLLDYEEQLSPGILRDIVYLTKRLQYLLHESDEQKQRDVVKELIVWLDTRHEVQREILSIRIANWLIERDVEAFAIHHLFHECMLRCPVEYTHADYRKHLADQYLRTSRPGYQAYLKQREFFQ